MRKSFKRCMVSITQKIRLVKIKILAEFSRLTKVCDIRVAFVPEFENMTNADKVLTQELEDMLLYIAKTGRVL